MQIARKASLGLAILGLVAGLALFPKTASAQALGGGSVDDPIVTAGTTYTPTFKDVTNLTFVNVTVTDATVSFTKAPGGFIPTTGFTTTFNGPIVFQPFQTKDITPISYVFTNAAPIGKYVFDINLYGTILGITNVYLGTTQEVVDFLTPPTATPEPSQTVALIIGALGIGGLMLLRRRKSLQA